MNRLIFFVFGLFLFSSPIQAKTPQGQPPIDDDILDKKQVKMIEERMEEEPSSTPIGGSRSGQLDIEKQEDDAKMKHDLEKQRQLYEYEDYYRRGL